jgi:hypothetical protein
MGKFWQWMKEKKYGYYDKQEGYETTCVIYDELVSKYDDYETSIKPTKQMLIGYMLEYINEKGLKIPLYIPLGDKKRNINKLYNLLKNEIKELLKEKTNGKNK